MSNRTIIEINHDCYSKINSVGFLDAIASYINSGSREDADDLERFGVRVFGMRHHSDPFSVTVSGQTFTK